MTFYHQPSMAPWGACDSYFVDSEDNGFFAQREEAREKARTEARAKQRVLGEELSRLTANEYQEDILDHMEYMELETLPDVNSIDIQTEIQWFMRPYLLDFLVEAHAAFSLLPDTLHLTINLLDRYCSRRVVYKRHYQLVGCAALLIASKYGDKKDRVPQIKELKSMCCSLYDDEMFTQMEWHVLQTLDWTIGHPTIDGFLRIAERECGPDAEAEHMALYICELAMFHKEFVSTLPSVLARSALCLARCILSRAQAPMSSWSGRYDACTVNRLFVHLHQPSPIVSKKYGCPQLSSVSITAHLFVQRQAELERARQLAPLTPPVEVQQYDGQKGYVDAQGNPQTPQKPVYSASFAHGLYTPPITPDNGMTMVHACDKPAVVVTPVRPSTPCPPSGSHNEQGQFYACHPDGMLEPQPHPHIPPYYAQ